MKISYLIVVLSFIALGCSTSDDSNSNGDDSSNSTLPVVSLSPILGITFVSAMSGGNVTDEGSSAVTARGLCWSLLPDPDINDNTTQDGSGSGVFSSELSSLDIATTYYVRAYATNGSGTSYSEAQSFTTLGNVLVGGIQMVNQAEVDAFGANNYTHVYGNVRILDEVVDLTPLSSLVEVNGQLVIGNTTNLANLNGLNNLALVRDLRIRTNDALRHLDALESLTTITGHIYLSSNHELLSIQGLQNVSTVEEYIWIISNITLPNLNGLENITSVRFYLAISNNSLLENIDALSNIQSVDGDLSIDSNDILRDLNGLSSLASVNGFFDIEQNYAITNLDPLNNLTNVAEYMDFTNNDELIDFCGLTPLLSGGGLGGTFSTNQNGYNPTEQDIIDGNCSL